eukprot:jgi/Mesvir1/27497/Mv07266-RA.1
MRAQRGRGGDDDKEDPPRMWVPGRSTPAPSRDRKKPRGKDDEGSGMGSKVRTAILIVALVVIVFTIGIGLGTTASGPKPLVGPGSEPQPQRNVEYTGPQVYNVPEIKPGKGAREHEATIDSNADADEAGAAVNDADSDTTEPEEVDTEQVAEVEGPAAAKAMEQMQGLQQRNLEGSLEAEEQADSIAARFRSQSADHSSLDTQVQQHLQLQQQLIARDREALEKASALAAAERASLSRPSSASHYPTMEPTGRYLLIEGLEGDLDAGLLGMEELGAMALLTRRTLVEPHALFIDGEPLLGFSRVAANDQGSLSQHFSWGVDFQGQALRTMRMDAFRQVPEARNPMFRVVFTCPFPSKCVDLGLDECPQGCRWGVQGFDQCSDSAIDVVAFHASRVSTRSVTSCLPFPAAPMDLLDFANITGMSSDWPLVVVRNYLGNQVMATPKRFADAGVPHWDFGDDVAVKAGKFLQKNVPEAPHPFDFVALHFPHRGMFVEGGADCAKCTQLFAAEVLARVQAAGVKYLFLASEIDYTDRAVPADYPYPQMLIAYFKFITVLEGQLRAAGVHIFSVRTPSMWAETLAGFEVELIERYLALNSRLFLFSWAKAGEVSERQCMYGRAPFARWVLDARARQRVLNVGRVVNLRLVKPELTWDPASEIADTDNTALSTFKATRPTGTAAAPHGAVPAKRTSAAEAKVDAMLEKVMAVKATPAKAGAKAPVKKPPTKVPSSVPGQRPHLPSGRRLPIEDDEEKARVEAMIASLEERASGAVPTDHGMGGLEQIDENSDEFRDLVQQKLRESIALHKPLEVPSHAVKNLGGLLLATSPKDEEGIPLNAALLGQLTGQVPKMDWKQVR